MVQRTSLATREDLRAYSVKIDDIRVRELITWYKTMLQKAVDEIWINLTWRCNFKRYGRGHAKVKVPMIPKSKIFKKYLRDRLMKNNPYASHWVDAVIRTAYSIMKSWRKRYVKGKARKAKPIVRKRFARSKITLMKIDYNRKVIRIKLKPYGYIEVSYANKWFTKGIEGWRVGEVIYHFKILYNIKRLGKWYVNLY